MDLSNICVIGKNEYAIKKKQDLLQLSLFAYVGSKAYCQEDNKNYLQIGVKEWISI